MSDYQDDFYFLANLPNAENRDLSPINWLKVSFIEHVIHSCKIHFDIRETKEKIALGHLPVEYSEQSLVRYLEDFGFQNVRPVSAKEFYNR